MQKSINDHKYLHHFRLGNILDTSEGWVKVTGIPYGQPVEVEPFPHSMEQRIRSIGVGAVPLSEEIMLKAGFSKQMPAYPEYTLNGLTIRAQNKDYFLVHVHDRVGKPFEYLHQLQNVYFALTGEELNLEKMR